MSRLAYSLILLLCTSVTCRAQIVPAEGSKLTYRLVGFSVPGGNGQRTLEIAEGTYNNIYEFEQRVAIHELLKATHCMVLLPAFGKDYTWSCKGADGKPQGALHHFTVLNPTNPVALANRINVTQLPLAYKDAHVFSDQNRALYDMSGNMVWFLPDIEGLIDEKSDIRDLKMTSRGTITLLSKTGTKDFALEISYDGKVLWKGPDDGKVSGGTTEGYHHVLTRLNNGHYMVCGTQQVKMQWRKDAAGDSSLWLAEKGPGVMSPASTIAIPFATVIEYDTKGNVVWSWKQSDDFVKEEQQHHKNIRAKFDDHQNGFCFDERNKMLYVSFRDKSEILKINYPEGRTMVRYGYGQTPANSDALFSEQHSIGITARGELYLYNNNICNLDAPPTIEILRDASGTPAKLKKIWEYAYPVDMKGMKRPPVANWGNVTELPDGAMFVSTGLPYGNLFIVSKDKKILWGAVLQHWNDSAKKWDDISQYRASIIISKKQLEELVLH